MVWSEGSYLNTAQLNAQGIDAASIGTLTASRITSSVITASDRMSAISYLRVNDTTTADMDTGIKIDQTIASNHIFEVASSTSVAHGFTSVAGTGVYGYLSKSNALNGGLRITSIQEDANNTPAFAIDSYGGTAATNKDNGADALIELYAAEHDGADSIADVTANGNVIAIKARVGGSIKSLFVVDEDGDLYADGGTSTTAVTVFDEHDDAQLCRAFDVARSPDDVVRTTWDDHVQYKEEDLVAAGVLGAPLEDGGLLNISQLLRLHNGAIWQGYTENQQLRADNDSLKSRLDTLEQRLLPAET